MPRRRRDNSNRRANISNNSLHSKKGKVIDVRGLQNELHEMFPNHDPEVLNVILEQYNNELESVVDYLFKTTKSQEQCDATVAHKLAFKMEQDRKKREAQEKTDEKLARKLQKQEGTIGKTSEQTDDRRNDEVPIVKDSGKWQIKRPPNTSLHLTGFQFNASMTGTISNTKKRRTRRRRRNRKPKREEEEGKREEGGATFRKSSSSEQLLSSRSVVRSISLSHSDSSIPHSPLSDDTDDTASSISITDDVSGSESDSLLSKPPYSLSSEDRNSDVFSEGDLSAKDSDSDEDELTKFQTNGKIREFDQCSFSGDLGFKWGSVMNDLELEDTEYNGEDDDCEPVYDMIRFVSSIFPSFEKEFLKDLFEENSYDLTRTIESLLSLTRILEETEVSNTKEASKDGDTKQEEYESVVVGGITLKKGEDGVLMSDFTLNLKTLSEMFPDIARPLLAIALEQNDDHIEHTIEYLLSQASSDGSDAGIQYRTNHCSSNRTPNITKWGHNKSDIMKAIGVPTKYETDNLSSPKPQVVGNKNDGKIDMGSSIKFEQLCKRFTWIDRDILFSVFYYNNNHMGKTVEALNDLYPSSNWTTPNQTNSTSEHVNTFTQYDEIGQEDELINDERYLNMTESERQNYKREYNRTRRQKYKFQVVKKKERKPSSRNLNTPYVDYRQQALEFANARNNLFMEATRAYMRGDRKAAFQLSQRGKEFDKLRQEASAQICHQIFSNPRQALKTVDLHRLHVDVALRVLDRLLLVHERSPQPPPLWVSVITGVGRHSAGGRARIKPAVIQFLRQNDYTFKQNGGVIVIKVKK
eukprot:CAMPEP_0174267870 /NCGR_PEP_ID=MMETSP0439-20130205/35188_1 /TAXON_ID=0 /ORGANISM="Stereomyxa ramosa, Strain Chinc5" /LENGTH=809 /DNA_ID=CAMNT_0015355629 /DNA_START=12 /DNA_END=2441 /DNA_ORIENTATION=-